VLPTDVIDVNSLIEESMDAVGSERAPLYIKTQPTGCTATVGGHHLSSVTPTLTTIDAGREIRVDVQCPGLPEWSGHVMAAPGQNVELNVFPVPR
jgi:hypothetical protein